MLSGILSLNKETLELLVKKHSEPREPSLNILIQGPTRSIHPVAYDDMDESAIMKTSMITKDEYGPSDCCHKILTSCAFGTVTLDLHKAFAHLIHSSCVWKSWSHDHPWSHLWLAD